MPINGKDEMVEDEPAEEGERDEVEILNSARKKKRKRKAASDSKPKKKRRVAISVGRICSMILKNEVLRTQYKELMGLFKVYLVFTVASAECERGVSVLKLIKTPHRNSLQQSTLEQLMMIKINLIKIGWGALGDFDLERAAKIFFSNKERRVQVAPSYKTLDPSGYKWGNVRGLAAGQVAMVVGGPQSLASIRARILTGAAPPDSRMANEKK